jgi:hypothetical protein
MRWKPIIFGPVTPRRTLSARPYLTNLGGQSLSFDFFCFDGDLDVRGYFAMKFDRHVKLT